MALLMFRNYEFPKILASGYIIDEDVPNILAEYTMADGTIRRNYGRMPKTNITVKFSQLDQYEYMQIVEKLGQSDGEFTYYSPKHNGMMTKLFNITYPTASVNYEGDPIIYDEFEIKLEQCGEVS